MPLSEVAPRRWRTTLLWAAIALGVPGLFAQPTGKLHVEVRDPNGAAIQAQLKLENTGTGKESSSETDTQGVYDSSDVQPGRYRLEISRTGFATQSMMLKIDAAAPVSRTVTLALASQTTRVDVVEATPLTGTDIPVDQIPAPVQTLNARDLEKRGALNLPDLLDRQLSAVQVNQNQENPYQPDVNYRGYTASPLLGTPEGISVYMDGVRQNQPFGDIVAWDLIPKVAISEVSLMPGSDPLFGLNTLGGALSIQTKDGYSAPGGELTLTGGSFGRREGELEYGGADSKGFNYYAGANWFREDGWRQHSPSQVRQTFGKLGWHGAKTSISLGFDYADNWLTGNGLQDFRRLQQDWRSVYTIPDITWNRAPSFNLSVQHSVTSKLTLSGNAYFRYIRTDTTNGDSNEGSFDQSLYNLSAADVAALTAAGYTGFPVTGNAMTEPFPFWRCIAQGLENDEPSEKCTATINNTFSKQHNWGLSAQASWIATHNHVTVGAAWDRSSTIFQQGTQFGFLDTDGLTITPINSYANGSTTQDGVPVDDRVNLHGLINTFSVYASDTLTFGKLAITASGRFNSTTLTNTDRLPAVADGSRGSLNGQDTFNRFNPSIGLTYNAARFANVYFNYSEASRAPTSIELGCADPNQPCNLPNALVGDPPLKQVVTRTFEAGARGTMEGKLRWSAGWFWGENHDDILFVASPQTGFGYFTNFGKTRRDGIETSLSRQFGKLTIGGNYTFLNATYQSVETISGSSNSANDAGPGLDGNITVAPGNFIPEIPRNIFKAYADYQATKKLSAEADFDASGRSYARGNENNLYQPDGVYYLGQGYSPGYGVLNVGAHYQMKKRVQVFVDIDNLLNHHYYTAAQLGPSPYNNSGNFIARPLPAVDGDYPIRHTTFFAPGAPIGAWGGLRISF